MTDKEKLLALFAELGIECEETEFKRNGYQGWDGPIADINEIHVNMVEGMAKVGGYGCSYAAFRFTLTGEFIQVDCLE